VRVLVAPAFSTAVRCVLVKLGLRLSSNRLPQLQPILSVHGQRSAGAPLYPCYSTFEITEFEERNAF
jgi:hypothetical protein